MNGVQKFQIHRDDRSTDRLPAAHTCFNQLDLPAYEVTENSLADQSSDQLIIALSDLRQAEELSAKGDPGVLRRIRICVRSQPRLIRILPNIPEC